MQADSFCAATGTNRCESLLCESWLSSTAHAQVKLVSKFILQWLAPAGRVLETFCEVIQIRPVSVWGRACVSCFGYLHHI